MDVKSTRTKVHDGPWPKEFLVQEYALQAAHYLYVDALLRGTEKFRDYFFFAVVTKEPPYMARLFSLSSQHHLIARAVNTLEHRKGMLLNAIHSGDWEGYENDEIQPMEELIKS